MNVNIMILMAILMVILATKQLFTIMSNMIYGYKIINQYCFIRLLNSEAKDGPKEKECFCDVNNT